MAVNLGIGYEYEGLVITSIDYKPSPTKKRPDRITFTGATPGHESKRLTSSSTSKSDSNSTSTLYQHNQTHEDAATFLYKCKYISGPDVKGQRVFEADRLSVKAAHKEFVKRYGKECKPLFAIHGFNSEPGTVMKKCKQAQGRFDDDENNSHDEKKKKKKKKTTTAIIPVIWPCINGIGLRYHVDKNENVPEAEKEFKMLLGNAMNVFQSKNLICHSMGNQVLRRVANGNLKFDNIFMVAADVRHDIFHANYINSAMNRDAVEKDGLRIYRMLSKHTTGPNAGKPKGKIYCLYNNYDFALALSPWAGMNWVNRLGQVGIGSYNDSWWRPVVGFKNFDEKRLVHPVLYGYTKNVCAYDSLSWKDYKSHGYQWDDFAIDFYKSKIEGGGRRSAVVSRSSSSSPSSSQPSPVQKPAPDCMTESLEALSSMLFCDRNAKGK